MPSRFDTFDDFMRDLDESSRLSEDPFELDSEIGALDDGDLELLGYRPQPRTDRAAPAKPKSAAAKKAPAKRKPKAKSK